MHLIRTTEVNPLFKDFNLVNEFNKLSTADLICITGAFHRPTMMSGPCCGVKPKE